ncbi:hypothetical protein AB7C87_18360 [Natrarchaeobius sp. A-rgal3]
MSIVDGLHSDCGVSVDVSHSHDQELSSTNGRAAITRIILG